LRLNLHVSSSESGLRWRSLNGHEIV